MKTHLQQMERLILIKETLYHLLLIFLEYDGKSKKAFAYGNVILIRPDMRLETDTLYLDRIKNIAYYNSRGKIIDNENTLRSNSGTYFMGPKNIYLSQM